MGRSSATEIVQRLVDTIDEAVHDPNAVKYLYHVIYEEFTDYGWDNIDEIVTDDACWYAMLCERAHHTPDIGDEYYADEDYAYVCRGCATWIQWDEDNWRWGYANSDND